MPRFRITAGWMLMIAAAVVLLVSAGGVMAAQPPRSTASIGMVAGVAADGGSAARRASAEPVPVYLSSQGDRFELLSNRAMSGAREVGPPWPLYNFVGAEKPEREAPVWAQTCLSGEQTVRLWRKVDIPGPPSEVQFNLSQVLGRAWGSTTPVLAFDLIANGRVVISHRVTSPAMFESKLTARELRAFRFGENTIEIRIRKGASPAALGMCNRNADTRLGVAFSLLARFSADLALVAQPPADEYLAAALTQGHIIHLTVRNAGPSGVLKGEFQIGVSGVDKFILLSESAMPEHGIEKLAPPFTGCRVDTTGAPTYLVVCTIERMKPGQVGRVTIGFTRAFQSVEFTEARVSVGWSVGAAGLPDPNYENNRRGLQIVYCGTLSTLPACKR